jgi:hypothetical protein
LGGRGLVRKAVITYIIDGYDTLKDPAAATPGWDYLCLSDDGLKSEIWRPVALNGRPRGVDSPKRKSSLIKIQHYDYVGGDYDLCITLDGSMQINCDLDAFLNEFWSEDLDISLVAHPDRDCLYDEADAVLQNELDDPEIVRRQIARYSEHGFPRRYGLYESRLMIKNNRSKRLRSVCDCWAAEYRLGSRRDQLSLTYAIWKDEIISGESLRIRSFDSREAFQSRELFRIVEHVGSRLWRPPLTPSFDNQLLPS